MLPPQSQIEREFEQAHARSIVRRVTKRQQRQDRIRIWGGGFVLALFVLAFLYMLKVVLGA